MRFELRTILAILLIGSQLLLSGFRGQAVALEGGDLALTAESSRGCVVLLGDETSKAGLPHRHDGLPLHMHVESEDAVRPRVQPLEHAIPPVPPLVGVPDRSCHGLLGRDDGADRWVTRSAPVAGHSGATTASLRAIRLRV